MKQLSNRLRFHRKQKGLTQLQVANYLGFKSVDRISKWENGFMYPHVVNAIKIAKLLEVKVEELYGI